jgi:hypothetical protein
MVREDFDTGDTELAILLKSNMTVPHRMNSTVVACFSTTVSSRILHVACPRYIQHEMYCIT